MTRLHFRPANAGDHRKIQDMVIESFEPITWFKKLDDRIGQLDRPREVGDECADQRLRHGGRIWSPAVSTVSPDIFKAYDIRGIYPDELDEAGAYAIGRAYVDEFEPRAIAVGRDMRNAFAQRASRVFRSRHGVNAGDASDGPNLVLRCAARPNVAMEDTR